jgi:DNA-binding NtrC family response regulator
MEENIKALLVQARPDPSEVLRVALKEQSIEIRTVKSCGEAALVLWSDQPPHLVFTDVQLADGNWADVLTVAAKACAPVNVIVVAPFADVNFYIQVIERGAFDFIVPPLTRAELLHVVRIAAKNALTRRRKAASAGMPLGSLAVRQHPDRENEHAIADSGD